MTTLFSAAYDAARLPDAAAGEGRVAVFSFADSTRPAHAMHEIYRALRCGERVLAFVRGPFVWALAEAVRDAGFRCAVARSGADALVLDAPVVVVAQGAGGDPDACAVSAADALHARCVLFGDADGLARGGSRLAEAGWNTAVALRGGEALSLARALAVELTLAAPGGHGTRVGRFADRCAPASPRRKVRVGLLGHGTVGTGLYRRLAALPDDFEVTGIAVRDPGKAVRNGAPQSLVANRCWRVVRTPCDVVVELIGGVTLPARLIASALKLGKHVVTANKAVIARHGPALEALARRHGVQLLYSASVGGAMPALETLRRTGRDVESFTGVLNATSNYVLDSIATGLQPADAVSQAQQAGYAEADPTLDLDGTDAAQKLLILARAAFGTEARIRQQGIQQIDPDHVRAARRRGTAVRLVATCRRTARGLEAEVAPTELEADHPLADTSGAENRLLVARRSGKPLLLSATGAGRWPTAEAVLADLRDVAAEVRS